MKATDLPESRVEAPEAYAMGFESVKVSFRDRGGAWWHDHDSTVCKIAVAKRLLERFSPVGNLELESV